MNIKIPIFMLLITTFAFCYGCASYSVSRPYLFGWHSEEEREIGKQVTLDLFYNKGGLWQKERAITKAKVTITEVTVSPIRNSYYLRVDARYENVGKKRMEWEYGNAYLIDSNKKMYEGRDYFDFVDILERPSRPFNFIESEAGMATENFVVFKVLRSAFQDKIFFGFVSMLDEDNIQGKILIFDNSKSSYSFSKEKSFTSINWSD